MDAGQDAELPREVELLAVIAHEVQDGEDGLAMSAAKAAAKLLHEDRRALGGPQEQHGVDIGDVEAFVEHVDGEEHIHFCCPELP